MEIRENDTICIFAPLNNKLGIRETKKLINKLQKESRNIALDLSNVTDCTIDFFENVDIIFEGRAVPYIVLYFSMESPECVQWRQ